MLNVIVLLLFVFQPRDMTFTYPDIIAEVKKTQEEDKSSLKKSLKDYYLEGKKKHFGVPSWFV